jgi:NAD(P)-dependent dehydrogenase (short-subunit alcohol dehydrogenase family)
MDLGLQGKRAIVAAAEVCRCHVTQLGGVGVALGVDHLEPEQVRGIAEQIRDQHGHIDVLITDIWGAEKLKCGPADWNEQCTDTG